MTVEVLVKVQESKAGDYKYTEMKGSKSGEKWIHIDNFKTQKNSVIVRKSDLMKFLTKGCE